MAQLLSRIDARLAQATDEHLIAELMAKKAAYLVRVGDSATARAMVAEVRKTFNDGRSGRVTCYLQIAEGLLHYYQFESAAALDRFTRALFLAEALREPDLICICAAWKAFVDFNSSRFEAMKRSLLLVRDLAGGEDHAVQSRFAVTVMIGALLLGRRDVGQFFFTSGHRHAVADGDQVCINSLLFDRSVFSSARLRVDWCRDKSDANWLQTARAELSSARNLQHLVGVTTMRDHFDLALARLDLIEGRFTEALPTLLRLEARDGFAHSHLNQTALSIEALYAQLQIGDFQAVEVGAAAIDLAQLDALDPDERVVGLSIWSKLTEHPAMAGKLPSVQARLEQAWSDYDLYESQLRHALEPWLTH
jgi:hypothetical protein